MSDVEIIKADAYSLPFNKWEFTPLDWACAYFGRIRTLIPETSGQRFGIIRTA